MGRVSINLTDNASYLYQCLENIGDIERLKSINHLGLLSNVFPTLNHTRYDYVTLLMVLSELVENSFKGTTSAQGSITIDGEKFFGNDLIKTWILLSNCGHCKWTIGDEKSLLLYAKERRGFETELLSKIKDDDLKEWSRGVIRKMDYIKFHHILSLYKFNQIFGKRIKIQKLYTKLYKLLLLEEPEDIDVSDSLKLIQLKLLYKNLRSLSIIALDTNNSHIPINIDIISTIVSFDFDIDRFQSRKLDSLFDPMINLLYDKIYLHKDSQTLQRSYEIKSLSNYRNLDYKKIVHQCMNYGGSDPENIQLNHFFRLKYKLPTFKAISEHYELIQEIISISNNYNASIDFNLNTRDAVVDFYIVGNQSNVNHLLPLFFYSIVDICNKLFQNISLSEASPYIETLSEIIVKCNNRYPDLIDVNELMQPSIEKLKFQHQSRILELNKETYRYVLWALIRYHLKEELYFEADSESVMKDIGVILPHGLNTLDHLINERINGEVDEDRVHELKHLKKGVTKKSDSIIIGFISRITIYNYSLAPSKRRVTDIDSVLCRIGPNSLSIEFNESKNTSNPYRDAKKRPLEKIYSYPQQKCKRV